MTPPAARGPDRLPSERDALLAPDSRTPHSERLPLLSPGAATRERLDSVEAVNKALALSVGEVAAPDAFGFRCVHVVVCTRTGNNVPNSSKKLTMRWSAAAGARCGRTPVLVGS